MKVLHLGYSDLGGGGFIAPTRICRAQREAGIDAWYGVIEKRTIYDFVIQLPKRNGFLFKVYKKFKNFMQSVKRKLSKSNNPIMQSINDFSILDVKYINQSDFDLIQLHWINHNMISIKDLSKITKPLIFTLHDNWLFCGSEHYINVLQHDTRYIDGYKKKPDWQSGSDLPKHIFNKKLKHFKNLTPQVINPSKWQNDLYLDSYFYKKLKFQPHLIPNITDSRTFYPIDKDTVRGLFNLPKDHLIICFGSAYDYTTSVNIKGSHLLVQIFKELAKLTVKPIMLLAFGPASPSLISQIDYPVYFTGQITNEAIMNSVYNCSDIFLCPSLLENLPLTILEANHCEIPTVAFDASGTKDLIRHKITGYLAHSYDVVDFAKGIQYCAENLKTFANELKKLNKGAFSERSIIEQYKNLYSECVK